MENNLEQIKMLNLTEEDFKLLVDGLDALPEKGFAGEMMGDLLIGLISKGGEEEKERLMKERQAKREKLDKGKEIMKENIKILQGKLLMLKRYFQENDILKQTYEVLSIPNQS
jgi:hypothetical protein